MERDKLTKYRSMRDFSHTAEPSGARARDGARSSFVIQQHAARRMHYDFRLELDGVLLSWAVPKGPSLSPADKRLAVRTEDHPLDYAGFEGIIPKGRYGGGTVSVWDRGTWEPEGDPHEAMKQGRLTFELHGEKLHGRWHLIRTRGRGKADNWLLFKSRDAAANENEDIVAQRPESVVTGRTLDQIAGNGDVAALVKQLPLGFELTHLDKVLYPEQNITKAQLVAYLAVVADWMLPHVGNRPLTLVRCPDGRTKPCFFQKKISAGAPSAVHSVTIDGDEYMTVRDMPGLIALAQLGTLETHVWGCHADKIERPDFMVFDLDPDEGLAWDRVALAAFDVRKRLRELGLESWIKTTGGKGLHVCVPLARKLDWDRFKTWSKAFAETLAHDEPALYTSSMAKSARRGKIFVDYLRNGRNATFICAYSPRARENAPVSTPITWEELARGVEPHAFTTRTIPARLGALERDPWHGIYDAGQSITAAMWKAV
jgi:bifunctional non-homologous end joining protein LigD